MAGGGGRGMGERGRDGGGGNVGREGIAVVAVPGD